jgi:lysozyme family protein
MEYPDLFRKCIKIVLRNEGGSQLTNHPADPGGLTRYGICKRYYPNEDIENLTEERAIEIFYNDYWVPMNLEGIFNKNLVLQIFDFGVNAGTRRSAKMLQRLVGAWRDGIIGPKTRFLVNTYKGDLLSDFKQARVDYYVSLVDKNPAMRYFIRGWLNRVDQTYFI